MGVVDPPNQLPEADLQLPLHEPLGASLHDPLSEFAPERTARRERLLQFEPPPRERLIEFEPDWRGPGQSDRLGERAFAAAPNVSRARAPKGRWLLAAAMLGVGLVAGFAGGMAVVTKYGGNQNGPAGSLTSNRLGSEIPRADVQPPPPPVADRPAGGPIASPVPPDALSDPAAKDPQTAVASVTKPAPEPARPAPEPPREQPAPRERVAATPVTAVTGLYVQSSPAGADVYLDEKLISTTPFQLSDIAPGQHTIRIDMPGYRSWSMPVSIERGVRAKISAVLER